MSGQFDSEQFAINYIFKKTSKKISMKNDFKHILSNDLELSEGLDMILKNEGLDFEELDAFFEESEKAFEEKVNYEKTRQAIIYHVYSYSNAAVVVALMVAFIILPIFGYASNEFAHDIGPYDLGLGLKVAL